MVNKDTMVGIVGAVVLVGAMVGVFYFESARAPAPGALAGGAGSTAMAGLNETLTLQLGPGPSSAAEEAFTVPAGNWTSFKVKVTAAPSGGAPGWVADSVTLTLTGPSGEEGPTLSWEGPQTGSASGEINVDAGAPGEWRLHAHSNALAGTGVTLTAQVAVTY